MKLTFKNNQKKVHARTCVRRESMRERIYKYDKMLTFGESNEKYIDIHCTAV